MNICVACKGRGFCGKKCAVFERMEALMSTTRRIVSPNFAGTSPPAVFVGHSNYPNVNVGLLVPSWTGDTNLLDNPERWYQTGKDIPRIIRYRSELINSNFSANVRKPECRLMEVAQEITLSEKPVDTEVLLKKIPSINFVYDTKYPPLGPSAGILKARITSNPSIDPKVDYLTGDTDAKASTAILELYRHGVSNTELMKILSIGLLGTQSQRRLVPTRWSITAVDDTIGKKLMQKIKYYQTTDNVQVFFNDYLGNHFTVLLFPRAWSFELMETYFPGSVWAFNSQESTTVSDYESFFGRKTYASNTGGAYYAIRLAVLEYLEKIRRQASALVLREVRKDYYAPLGVWVTRETVRGAFKQKPFEADTTEQALQETGKRMLAPAHESRLLREIKTQKNLRDYL